MFSVNKNKITFYPKTASESAFEASGMILPAVGSKNYRYSNWSIVDLFSLQNNGQTLVITNLEKNAGATYQKCNGSSSYCGMP